MAEKLPKFEGKEVVDTRAKVTNSGDGLSQAMHFEHMVIHQGQRGYLVLEWECVDVQHPFADPKKPTQGLARTHVLRAETGLIVDETLVKEMVDKQKAINAAHLEAEETARREARGEFKLALAGDDPAK